jgi:putative flavoprotein involved in K+ transport
MSAPLDTVIIGGGQAGLSVSYYLTKQAHEHVVFEQANAPAEAWRNHRWDSFTLNTPNWQTRLPGADYQEGDPDGFMFRREVIAYLENYTKRFQLPVWYGLSATSVARDSKSGFFRISLANDRSVLARNAVIATGLYQKPKIPAFSAALPPYIKQFHSDNYRNPEQLLPGAVLVVGSAQSGAQITEELYLAGRKIYLAVGRAGRVPRRYRGKDANWWSEKLGVYDRTAGQLPSPKARFASKPHISGTMGGHTLNLHQFARDGVTLLGHMRGVQDGKLKLAADLWDSLAAGDQHEAEFVKAVDAYIATASLNAPEEKLPALRDGFATPLTAELDLEASDITNVIWATSYAFDFSLVKLPIFDSDGFPVQKEGMTAFPGLAFAGLPWLPNAKSGLLYGVGENARSVAEAIMRRQLASSGLKRAA